MEIITQTGMTSGDVRPEEGTTKTKGMVTWTEDLGNMRFSKMISHNEPSFRFDRKTTFSASKSLADIRSKSFVYPETVPDYRIWSRKAPDFSPKLYRSLNLPRNTRESKQAASIMTNSSGKLDIAEEIKTTILPEIVQKKESPKFIAKFKPPDPQEARIMFVKTGKFPTAGYKDPKPHDFRQYEDNIPDFNTSYERDPWNLNFKSQQLNASLEPVKHSQEKTSVERFDTYKPQELKWDSKLILPKKSWPPKSASYTRHRRRRGVYSALMDRVEDKLANVLEKDEPVQKQD